MSNLQNTIIAEKQEEDFKDKLSDLYDLNPALEITEFEDIGHDDVDTISERSWDIFYENVRAEIEDDKLEEINSLDKFEFNEVIYKLLKLDPYMKYTIEDSLENFFLEVPLSIYGDDDTYKLFEEFAAKEGFIKKDADNAMERYYEDAYESNLNLN